MRLINILPWEARSNIPTNLGDSGDPKKTGDPESPSQKELILFTMGTSLSVRSCS